MDKLLGIVLCIVAITTIAKSLFGGRMMSSVMAWLAILMLFPGILMAFGVTNLDVFLGSLPIIGPVFDALGLISANTTKNDWIDFIMTAQIACLIGFTCWGANGFLENLVMKVVIAGTSYFLLFLIKIGIASVLPNWVDIALIAVMLLFFFLLYRERLILSFLGQVVIVFCTIAVLGVLLGASLALVDAISPIISVVATIFIIVLGIRIFLRLI